MKTNYAKLISLGAAVALAGFVLSGPVAFFTVRLIQPQPAWTSAAVFAQHYHTIQDLPFYFGFLLIGGMLMLVAGHYLNYREQDERLRFHLLIALGWTVVFCALISFNYIAQTTFVRHLALHYQPAYDPLIAGFSMTNPLSFCWANEMWGYALLGVATWLLAGYYRGRNPLLRGLLITNGITSLLSAFWTAFDAFWVMTTAGLAAYFVWNVLMIAIMIAIYRDAAGVQN